MPILQPPERGQNPWRLVLAVALVYYLSGRLGLLLAIPPGYATAVWPASGIGLAAVMLWGRRAAFGILLGSFCINLHTAVDPHNGRALAQALYLPLLIGTGAALQAVVGATLIERRVGYRNLLGQEDGVIWMFVLGGPLACVVSASIGVFSLYASGLIPADNLPFNWWTWWVGDSIGVLIFTPLTLVWCAGNEPRWRRRRWPVTLPLMGLFAVVVGLFMFISHSEQARRQQDFEAICRDRIQRFQRDLQDDSQALAAMTQFAAAQQPLQRDAFVRFADSQLALLVGLKSFSWVSVVPDEQRNAFEARIRAQGQPDFQIMQHTPDGRLLPAPRRPLYAPVTYVAPEAGNARALGFDDESEPVRAEALARARATLQPTASRAITLVQDERPQRSMLLLLALADERGATQGYAIAAVRTDRMIEASLGDLAAQGIVLAVNESEPDGSLEWFYGQPPPAAHQGLRFEHAVTVGGLPWQLHFWLPETYLVSHRSWPVWTLLAGGMLFTGLLGMLILALLGRGERVQQLVEERTVAIARANERLTEAAARSEALEREAQLRATQLAASNRELEQFAYVASHDLQAPLRSISGFAAILEKRYKNQLSEEANEFLAYMRESVSELQQLIRDLLQLSRVNPQEAERLPVPLADAVRRAREQLDSDIRDKSAVLVVEPLPVVQGDLRLLTQLFQNLIGNAIKFQREGEIPSVRISAERVSHAEWRCVVADNGIGIAPEQASQIFRIFKRLHRDDRYGGSGIGLALCHKIVSLHGGRIGVESAPGAGSRFYFTLPAS
jgi:signal transduction histidine kinase